MNTITIELLISGIVGLLLLLTFIYFLWIKSPYKKGADLKPTSMLAFAKYFDNDYKNALDVAKKIVVDNNASFELYLLIANIYRIVGENVKAAQNHELILHMKDLDNSSKLAITNEIAKDYLNANMPSKAITILSNYPDALSVTDNIKLMAIAHLKMKNYKQAMSYYDSYLKRSDNKLIGFAEKVLIDQALHTTDESKIAKFIKEALANNPKSRAARFVKASITLKSKDEKKIAQEYISILEDNLVRDIADLKNIEEIAIQIGFEDKLKTFIDNAILENSNNPFVYICKANMYLKQNKNDKALEILSNYIEKDDAKAIVLNYYVSIKNDKLLEKILGKKNYYACSICNTEYEIYHDDCKVCLSNNTINLI